jgi:hypothetical protein
MHSQSMPIKFIAVAVLQFKNSLNVTFFCDAASYPSVYKFDHTDHKDNGL